MENCPLEHNRQEWRGLRFNTSSGDLECYVPPALLLFPSLF